MKQHITLEQLWELCPDSEDWSPIIKLNTLANIYFPNGIISHPTFNLCCETTAEQMTIGKMIEILLENNYYDGYFELSLNHNKLYKIGESIYNYDCSYIDFDSKFTATELCDVLWEAVKEIL